MSDTDVLIQTITLWLKVHNFLRTDILSYGADIDNCQYVRFVRTVNRAYQVRISLSQRNNMSAPVKPDQQLYVALFSMKITFQRYGAFRCHHFYR